MSDPRANEFDLHVRNDGPDHRDRLYPPTRISDDDIYRRPRELFLDDLFADDVDPLPDAVDFEHYRALASPTRQQRGEECTGFALAAIADYHLRKNFDSATWNAMSASERAEHTASRRMLYETAQVFDRYDFEEGSTLRGALKGWRRVGVAADSLWPYDPHDEHGEIHGRLTLRRTLDAFGRPGGVYYRIHSHEIDKIKDALARDCPLYASSRVHVGWFRLFLPGDDHLINRRADDKELGGHAFVIVGYDERGLWIQNSWGPRWGRNGFGQISWEEWADLGQDVWFVVPPPAPRQAESAFRSDDPSADSVDTHDHMWRHLITLADDGRLATTGPFALDEAAVKTLLYLFEEHTADWSHRRLAVFADGGYESTEATVERLRPLCDELMANEIYPIFLLWQQPRYPDVLRWLLGDSGVNGVAQLNRDELDDFWDRNGGPSMAKVMAVDSVAPRAWDQVIRRSRDACTRADGGARIFSKSIAYKWGQESFDIHLVSHGTGDLLMAEFLSCLEMPIASCELWGPALHASRFASTYAPMLDSGQIGHVTITTLPDESEQRDRVGPLPGSVLVLMSEVLVQTELELETALVSAPNPGERPTWGIAPEPILGMQRFLVNDAEFDRLTKWGLASSRVIVGEDHPSLATERELHRQAIRSMLDHEAPHGVQTHDEVTDPLAQAIREAWAAAD